MSQIFDAIHRSEVQRRGVDIPEVTAAPEVLEVAERERALDEVGSRRRADTERNQLSHLPATAVVLSPACKLVAVTDGEGLAAEKFRFFGVRLKHLQQKRNIKRLLITSSLPAEGKSTIAGNLATILAAKEQQKVLLLEGDLRRPTLAKQFGLGNRPGLSEWLQGEDAACMNICRLDGLGLWVLPAGNPPADPLELLQSDKLSGLMDRLSSWFDWIVIDSPPVLPLGDTSVWMRRSDGILLVTRPGQTEKRQLQRTLEAVEQPKLLGVLVNASNEATQGDYYRHYYSSKAAPPQVSDQQTK